MALFRLFHGEEKDLNTQIPITEGRNYFLVDNGKMYIDTANERICLNAEEADVANALKSGEDMITANQLVKNNDTISIAQGGTGAKTVAAAREGLQIDRAIATVITLVVGNWVASGNKFTQEVALTTLTCGSAGNVPPVISAANGTTMSNFAVLESVDADVENKKLVFIAKSQPISDIGVIITDHQ